MSSRPSPLLLALLPLLLLGACSEQAAPSAPAAGPVYQEGRLRFPAGHPQLKLLTTAPAETASAITIDLPAKLVWNEEHTQRIYPAFAGRVVSIHADVGQRVKPGTRLAQLASPDFGQAQSETARAEADASLAAKNLQRQRELFEAGIVARKELEQAEADDTRARAELDRARGRTQLYGGAGQVNQQMTLSATIPGIVVERNLNPGQELRPEQSGVGVPALFVISDPTTLWVQIDVREGEINLARRGATFNFTVDAMPGTVFKGRVVTTTDFIDPQTRTIKIRGIVDNKDRRLKAEMLATARLQRNFSKGVVVPASAVLLRGTTHSVFVQTRPGEFDRREVELDYEGSNEVVISAGVQAGESVVIENALLLARMRSEAAKEARGSDPDGSVKDTQPAGGKKP